jgi:hypothetical protein
MPVTSNMPLDMPVTSNMPLDMPITSNLRLHVRATFHMKAVWLEKSAKTNQHKHQYSGTSLCEGRTVGTLCIVGEIQDT